MNQEQQKEQQKKYADYVKEVTPTHSLPLNMAKAFLTGGLICVLGQAVINALTAAGMEKEAAMAWTQLFLIGLSILLTGLNIFPKITKFAGAGTLVPITGFANSVAAPAIEFRREGMVLGLGARLFQIAGPVLTYGISASIVVGLVYWAAKEWFL